MNEEKLKRENTWLREMLLEKTNQLGIAMNGLHEVQEMLEQQKKNQKQSLIVLALVWGVRNCAYHMVGFKNWVMNKIRLAIKDGENGQKLFIMNSLEIDVRKGLTDDELKSIVEQVSKKLEILLLAEINYLLILKGHENQDQKENTQIH